MFISQFWLVNRCRYVRDEDYGFEFETKLLFFFLNTVPRSSIDDEYANATVSDPKILLITSRDPSAPLAQFVKVVPCLI